MRRALFIILFYLSWGRIASSECTVFGHVQDLLEPDLTGMSELNNGVVAKKGVTLSLNTSLMIRLRRLIKARGSIPVWGIGIEWVVHFGEHNLTRSRRQRYSVFTLVAVSDGWTRVNIPGNRAVMSTTRSEKARKK